MKNLAKYSILFLSFLLSVFYTTGQENYARNIEKKILPGEMMYITYEIVAGSGVKSYNVLFEPVINSLKISVSKENVVGTGHQRQAGKNELVWYYTKDFMGDINKVEINIYAYGEEEPKALAEITSISNDSYAPCEVKFKNNSSYANQYEWDFGDINSGEKNHSFVENPAHIYNKSGIYTIRMVARNTELSMETTWVKSIEIKEQVLVIADFRYEVKEKQPPYSVIFTSLSSYSDNFLWNFGDPESATENNFSDLVNPVHIYNSAGTFPVVLIAKNSGSGISDTITRRITLEQVSIPPVPLAETLPVTMNKHKTLKTVWLASSLVTAGTGVLTMLKSNSLYNDYKNAENDAGDLRKKSEKTGNISVVSFILSGVSVSQFIIQSGKQKKLSARIIPVRDGGAVALTIDF